MKHLVQLNDGRFKIVVNIDSILPKNLKISRLEVLKVLFFSRIRVVQNNTID